MRKRKRGRPKERTLTIRQQRALKFIGEFIKAKNYSPTLAEIGRKLGITRQSAASLVDQIEKKKFIKRRSGKPRTIRLTGSADAE